MERTPYLRYLKECLQFSRGSGVMGPEALVPQEALEALEQQGDEVALCLLARLLLRSGEWHRSDRLLPCLPRDLLPPTHTLTHTPTHTLTHTDREGDREGESVTPGNAPTALTLQEVLQEALQSLSRAGLLETLSPALHGFPEAWTALTDCLLAEEARQVHLSITKKKPKGDKNEVFNGIYKAAKSSVDLFARPLCLVRQLQRVLQSKEITLVRLSPSLLHSLRRMQRVMQASSASGEVSSGRSCLSTSRPLPFNAAMLTMVGQVRFPRYEIVNTVPLFPSTESFHLWEAANELRACFDEVLSIINKKTSLSEFMLHPSFSAQPSADIRSPLGLELGGLTPVQKTFVLKMRTRILAASKAFDTNHDDEMCTDVETEQIPPSVDSNAVDLTLSSDDEDGKRYTKSEAFNKGGRQKSIALQPSLILQRLLELRTSPASRVPADSGDSDQTYSLSLLSFITLGSTACLLGHLQKQISDDNGKLTQSLPFLHQLDAGNLLTAICFDGIDMMEKEIRENRTKIGLAEGEDVNMEGGDDAAGADDRSLTESKVVGVSQVNTAFVSGLRFNLASYALPIQILRLLVHGDYQCSSIGAYETRSIDMECSSIATQKLLRRYCSRRVGKTVERLCIDLEHEGHLDWSLQEVTWGLQDCDVQSSYHIGFNKRRDRLLLRQKKKRARQDVGHHFPSLEDMLHRLCRDDTGLATIKNEEISQHSPAISGRQKKRKSAVSAKGFNETEISSAITSKKQHSDKSSGMPSSWACSSCTLLNSSKYWRCTLCHADRVSLPSTASASSSASPKAEPTVSEKGKEYLDDSGDENVFEVPSMDKKREIIKRPRKQQRGKVKKVKHGDTDVLLNLPEKISESDISTKTTTKPSLFVNEHSDTFGKDLPPWMISDDLNCGVKPQGLVDANSGGVETRLNISSSVGYCTLPLTNVEMKHLLFNGISGDYTTKCFHEMVQTVVVTGRRLGSLRPGKNKLIGVCGNAVSVEKLVMQTMEGDYEEGIVTLCTSNEQSMLEGESVGSDVTEDKTSHPHESSLENFCGGWVGWHCEGSPLRTIFGLMMWSEIFPIGQSEDYDNHLTSPISDKQSRIWPGSAVPPVADVFQTPYQDAPLDLLTPGGLFYCNRQAAIDKKLSWIKAASTEDIVAYLGKIYRDNYRSRCACVSWSIPLKTLQLVAAALHFSGGVLAICKLMSVDYRQFSSGAPDLLMVRGSLCRSQARASTGMQKYRLSRFDWEACLGQGWENLNGKQSGSGGDDGDDMLGDVLDDKEDNILTHEKMVPSDAETSADNKVGRSATTSKISQKKFVYVGGKRRYFGRGQARQEDNTSSNVASKVPPAASTDSDDITSSKHFSIFQKRVSQTPKKSEVIVVTDTDSDNDSNVDSTLKGGSDNEGQTNDSGEGDGGDEMGIINGNIVGEQESQEDEQLSAIGKGELTDKTEVVQEPEEESLVIPKFLPWRFRCQDEDLVLPNSPLGFGDVRKSSPSFPSPPRKIDGALLNLLNESNEEGKSCASNEVIQEQASAQEHEWTLELECMVVEVKGPTDRLSDRQRVWCQALAAHDVAVKVCRVHEGVGGFHVTAGSDYT